MNVRLTEVLCQVHRASGLRIIRTILKGERNAEVRTAMCDGRILNTRKPVSTINRRLTIWINIS